MQHTITVEEIALKYFITVLFTHFLCVVIVSGFDPATPFSVP